MTKKSQPLEDRRYHVPNLERALKMMEFLADHPDGYGISDIATAMAISKNSVFRIAKTLHAYEYLMYDEISKKYSLGRKLLALGHAAVGEQSLLEKSLDILRDIRDETKETTLLGTLIGREGIVLETVPGTQPITVIVSVGHRFPLHSAAPAKAMLAFMDEARQRQLLQNTKLKKYTNNTVTSMKGLQTAWSEARSKGYAVDRGEEIEEINCIAAPIFDHRGHPIAAVWVTAPASRLKANHFNETGILLKEKADQISRRFGYNIL